MRTKNIARFIFSSVVIITFLLTLPTAGGSAAVRSASEGNTLASPSAPDLYWFTHIVDSTSPDVGRYTSIVVDNNNYPHIAYQDATNDILKYARWDGSTWQRYDIDDTGFPGKYISLALDGDDKGHIAYFDDGSGNLDYAWSDDLGEWHTQTISTSVNSTGYPLSLKVDKFQNGHITFKNKILNQLYYAKEEEGNWTIDKVDAMPGGKADGYYPSLVLDGEGNTLISFCSLFTMTQTINQSDATVVSWRVILAHKDGATWQAEVVEDGLTGCAFTSLALTQDGQPRVAYLSEGAGVRYAQKAGSDWVVETVENISGGGFNLNLQLDTTDRPYIAHFDRDLGNLRYVYYNGLEWHTEIVDSGVNGHAAFALGTDGKPHLSYNKISGVEYYLGYASASALPDLVATGFWKTGSTVECQVMNIGQVNVPISINVEGLADGVQFGTASSQATLHPGERRKFVLTNAYTCSGLDDVILLRVDYGNTIQESDESNNVLAKTWVCDTTRPRITSGPAVTNISQTSATITWQTNKAADSQVDYGRNAKFFMQHAGDPALVTNHQIVLTSLIPNATYNYKVSSTDGSGNTVTSKDLVFTTLPVPASPPVIEDVTVMRRSGRAEVYQMSAQLQFPELVDRVEFYLDGELIGTDYSGPDFQTTLNPGMRGMARADFFTNHDVSVYAYGSGTVPGSLLDSFEPLPVYKPSELTIISPVDRAELAFETTPVPVGNTIHFEAYAVEYEWECDHSGGGMPDCDNVASGVHRIKFVVDGASILDISNLPHDQFITSYDLDVAGFASGNHTFNAYMYDHEGNMKPYYGTFTITSLPERPPEVTRIVERIDNYFAIKLAIKNPNLSTNLDIDYLVDHLSGFQPLKFTGANFSVQPTYDKTARSYSVNIDLFNGTNKYYTIPPNTTVVFMYNAVPILYEVATDILIGDNNLITRFKQEAVDIDQAYPIPGSMVKEPGGSTVTLASAHAHALRRADYLILTNPVMLSHQPGSVDDFNNLLSKMGQLAMIKDGALGFMTSYSSPKTKNLLNPSSTWAQALHDNYRLDGLGYVLIVGEVEVIPGPATDEYVDVLGDPIHMSDQEYSDRNNDVLPNLVLGRAVGDSLAELAKVIQNSIDVYLGNKTFDMSHAIVGSGWGGNEDFFQLSATNVRDALVGEGVSVNMYGNPLGSFHHDFSAWDGLAVCDYNADGVKDIAIIDRDDHVYYFNATGTPLWDFSVNFGNVARSAVGNVSTDFAGDEIVILDTGAGSIESGIYVYSASGTLIASWSSDDNPIYAGDDLTVRDLNDNGKADVIFGDVDGESISLWEVSGTSLNWYRGVHYDLHSDDRLAVYFPTGGDSHRLFVADRDDYLRDLDWGYPPQPANLFKNNVSGRDLIVFRGHGNKNVWDPFAQPDYFPWDFGSAVPVVIGTTCLSGNYEDAPGDIGMSNLFFNSGAGVYIGSTETSSPYNNNAAALWLSSHIDPVENVGLTFYNLECDKYLNDTSDNRQTGWGIWLHEYNYYGDPKFNGTSVYNATSQPESPKTVNMPQANLHIDIPNYTVTQTLGYDDVSIPRGEQIIALDEVRVPYWVEVLDYPAGTRVQDVSLTSQSGLTETTGLNLPVNTFFIEESQASPQNSATSGMQGWTPDPDVSYEWEVFENTDGSTRLVIRVFPFYYDPVTTNVKFYQSYDFAISTISTNINLNEVTTDKAEYALGETVGISLTIEKTGEPQDIVASITIIKASTEEIVDSLDLRYLEELVEEADVQFSWDSAVTPAGKYLLDVQLLDATNGDILQHKVASFVLGTTYAEVTRLEAEPELFQLGDTLHLEMDLANTGDRTITGTAYIQIFTAEGDLITTTQQAVNNLLPGNDLTVDYDWDTTGLTGEKFRIVGYIKYGSTLSNVLEAWVTTTLRVYLPLMIR